MHESLRVGYDDRALLGQAAQGDGVAFETLYRRHRDAAWQVAHSVVASPDDAADAVADAFTNVFRLVKAGDSASIVHFRAYLLSAVRNAAVDRHRRRERAVDDDTLLDHESNAAPGAADVVIDLTDGAYVVDAYRGLPERWQQVLWLTEIEGMGVGEAARILGMKPNAVAQLAFRARAGLRRGFVQAHLAQTEDETCSATVEALGEYVLGELNPSAHRRVEAHLDACADCRSRHDQIRDVVGVRSKV